MSDFSLSKPARKIFPRFIVCGGRKYPVKSDYRNILRILRMLKDEHIFDIHKRKLLAEWFYGEKWPENPVDEFVSFVFGEGSENADEDGALEAGIFKQVYDFEFDSEEIYASFIMEYGIDLIETEFMHWYKFKLLLNNLTEKSPFKKKIELRFADLNNVKGERLMLMQRMKDRVKLPENKAAVTEAESEFQQIWGNAGV